MPVSMTVSELGVYVAELIGGRVELGGLGGVERGRVEGRGPGGVPHVRPHPHTRRVATESSVTPSERPKRGTGRSGRRPRGPCGCG